VDAAGIVKGKMQRQRRPQILQLLAERIGQPREPAAFYVTFLSESSGLREIGV